MKLEDSFKVFKNMDRIYKKEFGSICTAGSLPCILYSNISIKTLVNNFANF